MILDNNYYLRYAVNEFKWSEGKLPLEISENDLVEVTQNIAKKIIAASQIKPNIETLLNRELSLVETSFLITIDTDKKNGSSVVSNITKASDVEKIILSHTFKKLSLDFIQLNEADLKAMTLVFGIFKISEIVSQKINNAPSKLSMLIENLNAKLKMVIFWICGLFKISETVSQKNSNIQPTLPLLKELEISLRQLKDLREKYSSEISQLPQDQKEYISKVDQNILQTETRINELVQKEKEIANSEQKVG